MIFVPTNDAIADALVERAMANMLADNRVDLDDLKVVALALHRGGFTATEIVALQQTATALAREARR